MYIFSYILKVYYYTRQHLRFSDISIDFIEARCFPGDKFCIKHCLTFKTPMEYGAAREKSDRVAPNEVTTRAAGGRHGAADSFDFVEAQHHETALCETARRPSAAPWDLPKAASFISANPLWTRWPPSQGFLAHYMPLRHHHRLCQRAYKYVIVLPY